MSERLTAAERAVAAARALVGTRFRLHGRVPAHGLDCVGVATIAMRAAGCTGESPRGYALRGGDRAAIVAQIASRARSLARVPEEAGAPGDLLLFAAGPAQFHLAVMVPGGFVHADAMLRRVTERPWPALWPIVAAWRPDPDLQGES